MCLVETIAANAVLEWTSPDPFRAPWLRYNPTINAKGISELDISRVCWDIVVREIRDVKPDDRTCDVVFQFASRRAPHHLLQIGLEFELLERPGDPIWRGTVRDIWLAPRSPRYWYPQGT